MRKGILLLAAVAFLATFNSCQPEVIITTPEEITIDLGSNDAAVLAGVEASNKDEVTVSGINYDHAGEQTATFAAGDVTLEKVIKVKTDKLAGQYSYKRTIDGDLESEIYSCTVTQSTTLFNKIIVSDLLDGVGGSAVCQGAAFTLDAFNVEIPDLGKAAVTGTGTFEKLDGGNYQISTAEITLDFEDPSLESWLIEIEFTKE
ncbi:MAG: hypothetical protein PHH25_06040 [Bacteroidales bacterium]|nr:hypothetical protein [Bacteroidales bacterium]MDD4581913.1 hypothetical protein [Bacteroidales bacterium]